MPTNLGHDAISALKVGHESVSAAYAGHQQIYPNTTLIQSAAYNTNAGMSNIGGTRIFQITGAVGATYDLTGSLTGSYTQSVNPTNYTVTANNVSGTCDAAATTYTTTLTPTGDTTLQGGGSTFSDAFTRAAGPGTTNFTASPLSISATNTNRVTTLVNGQLYWAAGSSWDVSYSYGGANVTNAYVSGFGIAGISLGANSGSGTWNAVQTYSQLSTMIFYIHVYSPGCYNASNSPASTGYLYP